MIDVFFAWQVPPLAGAASVYSQGTQELAFRAAESEVLLAGPAGTGSRVRVWKAHFIALAYRVVASCWFGRLRCRWLSLVW